MKVVQTFWSGGKNPLTDSYGWLSPQYNLMSWVLSCLSLKENYDEVVMYTDSAGYAILSKLLGLPYSEFILQYDNFVCPENQWAYAKIFTYSLQDKPFIHVDGDVYLPERLKLNVEKGDIITQNKEIGTEYYRTMVDRIMTENIIFPDFLVKELQNGSVSSYNAGILGGNDIEYIQKYCKAVFEYLNSNQLLKIDGKVRGSHNILFEQILLYALTAEDNKEVTTVLKRDVRDNGYSYRNFCNFYSYDKYTLMHIIGGHKRKQKTCELLSRTLLKKYPEYYQRIIELFPEKYERIRSFSHKSEKDILPYQTFADELSKKWEKISNNDLFDLEKKTCNYFEFLNSSDEKKLSTIIKRNPYLSIYEKNERQVEDSTQSEYDMALIPGFIPGGVYEVSINDLSYNILMLLQDDKTLKYLLNELEHCFHFETDKDENFIFHLILKNLENLFYNKLIYIDTI